MRSFLVDVCVVCCGVFQDYEVFVHMEQFIGGLWYEWFELQLQDVLFCIFPFCCYSNSHHAIQAWVEIFAYFKCG